MVVQHFLCTTLNDFTTLGRIPHLLKEFAVSWCLYENVCKHVNNVIIKDGSCTCCISKEIMESMRVIDVARGHYLHIKIEHE